MLGLWIQLYRSSKRPTRGVLQCSSKASSKGKLDNLLISSSLQNYKRGVRVWIEPLQYWNSDWLYTHRVVRSKHSLGSLRLELANKRKVLI